MHSAPVPAGQFPGLIADDAALRPAVGILFDAIGRIERDGHRCAALSLRSRLQRAVRLPTLEELAEEVRLLEADVQLLACDGVARDEPQRWQ